MHAERSTTLAGGSIDLNADLGEGFAGDAELLEVVTSASVACGAHAGDERTMAWTCAAAAAHGVRIGAHVSYSDRERFGRVELGWDAGRIERAGGEQIALLTTHAAVAGMTVAYVKAHGALYHRVAADREAAAALVAATAAAGEGLALLGPPGSALAAAAADAGLRYIREGFADRAYRPDGGLVERTESGAVLDAGAAGAQALALVRLGRFDSLCMHGDTPGAATLAHTVRQALEREGVRIGAS